MAISPAVLLFLAGAVCQAPSVSLSGKDGDGLIEISGSGSTLQMTVGPKAFKATTNYAVGKLLPPTGTEPYKLGFSLRFGRTGRRSQARFEVSGTTYSISSGSRSVVVSKDGDDSPIAADPYGWIPCELVFDGIRVVVRVAGRVASAKAATSPPTEIDFGCFDRFSGLQQELDVSAIKYEPIAVKIAKAPVVADSFSHYYGKALDPTFIYKLCQGSVITIYTHGASDALGTGFFIGSDLIATCAHVVRNASSFSFKALNGSDLPMDIVSIRVDPDADVAVIRVKTDQISGQPGVLSIQPGTPDVGEKVYAVGNPLGATGTMSDGIISGHRDADGLALLQFTCPITHGNSGGPLINAAGEVVGIVALGLVSTNDPDVTIANMGFAMPSSEILKTLAMPEP